MVYYEVHAAYVEAARREKRLKNWRRQWKLNLIETINSNGMIYMKIFAVDWDHLDAADKPRHVAVGMNCKHALNLIDEYLVTF